jgi:transcriptional regulator with XRE-family HTH domain
MEANGLNRTKLASHLGISKGRVSQILNDGEINFSLEKIIEIALKVGKFPVFEFQDKQAYFQKESKLPKVKTISMNYNLNSFTNVVERNETSRTKVVSFKPYNIDNYQFAVK